MLQSDFSDSNQNASIFYFSLTNSIEDDVVCLQGVTNSLSDPANKLSSWTFTNSSVASICELQGVACWNEKENRLISLQLPTMQLSGEVPEMTVSSEVLPKPPNPSPVQSLLKSVLDLSSNAFAGLIPPEIADCTA
ncbi:putative inactive receptor kinase At1g27190 [Castanea sativa]|uniref:putative inactive receptor kinase At1g27190 n=1 Tax=Castanea sativa TaxID=21020 RepID=UPI003F653A75